MPDPSARSETEDFFVIVVCVGSQIGPDLLSGGMGRSPDYSGSRLCCRRTIKPVAFTPFFEDRGRIVSCGSSRRRRRSGRTRTVRKGDLPGAGVSGSDFENSESRLAGGADGVLQQGGPDSCR